MLMKKTKKIQYNALDFNDWLKCPYVDADLKTKINNMSKIEKSIAFNSSNLEFGTAGVRAKMGPGVHYLNKFVYQQMMIGYCKHLRKKNDDNQYIVIGHDNRLHSADFAIECAKVACAIGLNVYLFEQNKLMPTPIISYTIKKLGCVGGVNITASHNPKEDNGFKVYNKSGAQVLPNEAMHIVKCMPSSKNILNLNDIYKLSIKKGLIKFINYDQITNDFFKEVINATVINKDFLDKKNLLKKFPIVFTGFHGTTTELMPKFLKLLGFKKIYLYPKHATISGHFEDCPISNPENINAFNDVIKFANAKKATVVFGCDPDGDRMTIGFKKTNRWRFLNGNELGIIFCHYILNCKKFENSPYILSTYVSTNYIDKIAQKYNAKVIRTKTGFKWMCNLIDKLEKNSKMVVAFEEAIGSLTHAVCRDKDCFGAICLALEILSFVSTWFVDLHDYIQIRIFSLYGATYSQTISYLIKSDNWLKQGKSVMNKALKFKEKDICGYKIIAISFEKESDSVKWQLSNDSWIKFRLSGTEPKFKIYLNINGKILGQLKSIAKDAISLIENKLISNLNWIK